MWGYLQLPFLDFKLDSLNIEPSGYVPPKQVWLDVTRGKGLQIEGTFSRKLGKIYMELTLTNKSIAPLSDFAIQFNTNS